MIINHFVMLLVVCVTSSILFAGTSFAVCVDYDGDGYCDAVSTYGDIPPVSDPEVDCYGTVKSYKTTNPNLKCTCTSAHSMPSCVVNDPEVDCYGTVKSYKTTNPNLKCTCTSAHSMPSCVNKTTTPDPNLGDFTTTERHIIKPVNASIGLAATAALFTTIYNQTPTVIVTSTVAVGAITFLLLSTSTSTSTSTTNSTLFLPKLEHYVMAAQFFHSAPLLAYSLPLQNDKTFSAIILMSPDGFSPDAIAISERPGGKIANALILNFIYEF